MRAVLMAGGIACIVVGVVVLGASLWESFGGFSKKVRRINLPGFHEINFSSPGLYAGVYQHSGAGPMPIKALTSLQVQVMSRENYEPLPVLMNTQGQAISRFGVSGFPLFNFMVQEPGLHTLSGVYAGGGDGPSLPIFLIAQEAGNIKQTLFVGLAFFAVFVALGVVVLVRLKDWAPAPKK